MKVKLFTFRPDPSSGALEDEGFEAWQQDKELLEVREQVLATPSGSVWALLVLYRLQTEVDRRRRGGQGDAPLVPTADLPLFEALRAWRNQKAVAEGKPAYVLLKNQALADLARLRPTSLEELKAISGIGDAKAQSFGQELLQLVAAARGAAP